MPTGISPSGRLDVAALLSELTLEEKVRLVEGVDAWHTNAIERVHIPAITLTDGPHGVRKVRDQLDEPDAARGAFDIAANEPSTSFPTASAVAASWDPENARRIGAAIGRESRWHGVDVLLAPGVNIVRDPRCGRAFEYFSEDPLLSGAFGAAFVHGVQSEGVAASVKHFAANSNEDYRFVGDSIVDERALREIYLRAFERIVKDAAPATLMCAYNRLGGTYCSENHELLTRILREEWGFDGLVMTDWGATHDRVAGVLAGLDLDMPGDVAHNRVELTRAVTDGRLPESALDTAVGNVLRLVDRVTRHSHDAVVPDAVGHGQLSVDVAADSAVLLANDGTLPLAPERRIAVVGELFEQLRFQGAGSSLVTPTSVTSAQAAFDSRGIPYAFARGYRTLDAEPDEELARGALDAAAGADVVLFFGGLSDLEESEGFDREHLRLSAAQTQLLEKLVATGIPVVLVLHAGSAVEVPCVDRLAAVLHVHLPGMHGGEATAALLLGERNPSGKLTQSWPRTAADISDAADFDRGPVALYYESVYVGYRMHDKAGTPLLFPFGHGLSYTTFEYRDLRVEVADTRVEVTVTVANTGERDGAEVVQLYVGDNGGAVFKPDKELRAFTKVRVPAGGEARARLTFDLADLAYWDVADHDWVLENGTYPVLIAASAADIRLQTTIVVTSGRESRSPYSAEIDRVYAAPPRSIPSCFAELVGRDLPAPIRSRRLTMETRLADGQRSLTGRLLFAALVGAARKEYQRAQRLPDSLDRDARVKNLHFVLRMMPTTSLRSMAMGSSGEFPYHVAAGIADIAAWRPVRGIRRILRGGRSAPSTDSTLQR